MPRQCQDNPGIGKLGKDIRLMRKKDNRIVTVNCGKRGVKIIGPDAAGFTWTALEGLLGIKSCQPEIRSRPQRMVLQDRETGIPKVLRRSNRPGASCLRIPIIMPVMVAENGITAKRRFHSGKRRGPGHNIERLPCRRHPFCKIAQKQDHVRGKCGHPTLYGLHERGRDGPIAPVQI